MKGMRGERLSSQFREEIYKVISTGLRNREPDMSAIISVLEADVSPDLKSCKVYISIYDLNEEKRKATFEKIAANAGSKILSLVIGAILISVSSDKQR